jgi:cobalt-zinc-cadmium efflux system protein
MHAETQTPHHHHHHNRGGKPLVAALVITVIFSGVEAVSGWLGGSLTLLGDAGHMITDATALGLALLATWIARRPPSPRHTYGLGRAEVIAAMVNGLLMFAIVASIVFTAVQRLRTPQPVSGSVVMGVAAVGLAVNLLVAFILSRGERTLNIRAALLHVMGDVLGSIAALIAGAVVYFTGWTPIDPLLSVFICLIILASSVKLMGDAMHVIMEGVPPDMDLHEVGRAMAGIEGVHSVHDLHIWMLSSGTVMLTAHVVVGDINRWERLLGELHQLLHDRFNITHATLQPEPVTRVVHPVRLMQS